MITNAAAVPATRPRPRKGRPGGRSSSTATTLALLSALAVPLLHAGTAVAQTNKSVCQNVGGNAIEPFIEQPGRSLIVSEYSCRVTEGPMAGSVTTGIGYWDVRGANWFLVAGSGMSRRPDAFSVYHQIEGKLDVAMKDGKPAGWTSVGRGRYQVASGAAASMAGKNFRWKAAPMGPNAFTLEADLE